MVRACRCVGTHSETTELVLVAILGVKEIEVIVSVIAIEDIFVREDLIARRVKALYAAFAVKDETAHALLEIAVELESVPPAISPVSETLSGGLSGQCA